MKRTWLCVVFLFLISNSASAVTLYPRDLSVEDLAAAKIAFVGVCKDVNAHIKDGVPVTTYKFLISEVVKDETGELAVGKEFSFTQWGTSKADAARLQIPWIYGIPTYEAGETYMLFLDGKTRLGFNHPVGLGFSTFKKYESEANASMSKSSISKPEPVFVNQYDNRGLFKNQKASEGFSKSLSAGGVSEGFQGPVSASTMKSVINSLNVPKKDLQGEKPTAEVGR